MFVYTNRLPKDGMTVIARKWKWNDLQVWSMCLINRIHSAGYTSMCLRYFTEILITSEAIFDVIIFCVWECLIFFFSFWIIRGQFVNIRHQHSKTFTIARNIFHYNIICIYPGYSLRPELLRILFKYQIKKYITYSLRYIV